MKEISKSDLKEIIREIVKEESRENHIEVSGIVVRSSTESLKKVQITAQKLINKNNDFLLARNKLRSQANYV